MKITRPILLLDKEKCRKNIQEMVLKAKNHNLKFRPHFKTHQSAGIGRWFKDFGVNSITVSSVEMAEYFSQNGWNDITIAFPFNQLEIDEINKLAQQIKLNILLVSSESIEFLKINIKNEIGFYIEVDTGYHRSGIRAENINEIDLILNQSKDFPFFDFKGFLTHSGNSYQAKSQKEISQIHHESLQKMTNLKSRYLAKFPKLELSIGDTPCCSLMNNFAGIDEIRPGNFVFYDIMQYQLGSCSIEQIAVALACPVVAKNQELNEIIIYGGAVHLSKEYILQNGLKCFGYIVSLRKNGWEKPLKNTFITSLSQEHGIIKTTDEEFNKINIGDIIGVLPVHSCLTANLMKQYVTLDGEIIPHMQKNN